MKRLITALSIVAMISSSLLPFISANTALAASTNLINNPSVETVDPSNSSAPQDWSTGGWGTNTPTYSYLNTGHTGSHSVEVQLSGYSSGDAEWYFTPVAIQANTQYQFSDYYESTASTEVDASFTMSDGTTQYAYIGTPASNSTWTQYSGVFTTPVGAVSATIYQLIYSNGSLTTDDYSLVSASTPTVSITAPTASSTISGTSVQLSSTAGDANGVASVQFQVDGANVGSPVTTAPYQYNLNTTTLANGSHTITAIVTNVNGITATSAPVQVTVNNASAIGTNIISNPSVETVNPSNSAQPQGWQPVTWGTNTTTFSYLKTGHTGTHSVKVQTTAYTSGASEWLASNSPVVAGAVYNFSDYYESNVVTNVEVQFTDAAGNLTYLDLGSPAVSSAWKQYSTSFVVPSGIVDATVYQYLSAVGSLTTDDYSLAESNVPSITLTSPTANSTVTGTTLLSANAQDNVGVASVQFEVDGAKVGSPVTTAPYQYSWNSASVTNGTHSIAAIVTNTSGKTSTSTAVSVEVTNTDPAGGNLVANPLLNTVDPSNSKDPQDWQPITWGTNTTTFSYLNSGSTGDSHSVETQVTKYTSGSTEWLPAPQNVQQDQQYKFSDYYKSNVASEVDASFYMPDGTIDYQILGLPATSSSWKQFTTTFSVPLGAQQVQVYQYISGVGTLTTDDYSITPYTPVGFNRPIVTLTFDDGYEDTFTNGVPLLQQYGFNSTQFIITDAIGDSGYVSDQDIQSMNADGEEIASHTVTHDNLTTETSTELKAEIQPSQQTLQSIIGAPVTDFAYPYGLYNPTVTSLVQQYYTAARGVEDGLNSKDNFNAYDLKVQDVYNTTTTAQIADWVSQAQATNTWLILVYHSVDPDTTSPLDGDIYNVTPDQLNSELAAVKASGVTVETMSQAYKEVSAQL